MAGILLVLLGVVIGRWSGAPRSPGDDPAPASELREEGPGQSGTSAVSAAPAGVLDATAVAPVPAARRGGSLVALVIDDLGRSVDTIDRLAALGVEMSYSVLPFESRTPQVVRELNERGAEILLHLPMEADGAADPGPGSLLRSMDSDELRRRTREALAAVPGAIGANNHMGSALSSDGAALEPVLVELGERGLFFLDSRTTADSVGFRLARELGIPAAERRVFLDREIDREAIRGQFRRLLEQAAERGSAIAIGHPYEETLDVLRQEVPLAKEAGFRFVPVSYLMERSGVEAM
ncbi:MAG TPA: divergent polysaccharide deacetylase family protein [Thermoanaerobaculia bacterium]|nr:divergent polysaccharide deacetylase family protein [Thermoanaerobaculia bacterium]